jgi:hypothetical protein
VPFDESVVQLSFLVVIVVVFAAQTYDVVHQVALLGKQF